MHPRLALAVLLAGCQGSVTPLETEDCAAAGACRCPESADVPDFGLQAAGGPAWAGPAEVLMVEPLSLAFARGEVSVALRGVVPPLPLAPGDRVLAVVADDPGGRAVRLWTLEADQEPGALLLWAFEGDAAGGEARGIRAAASPMACGALWPNALAVEVEGQRAVLPPGTTAQLGAYEAFNGASFGLERLRGWIVRSAALSSPR
jgi:hypothetical protein